MPRKSPPKPKSKKPSLPEKRAALPTRKRIIKQDRKPFKYPPIPAFPKKRETVRRSIRTREAKERERVNITRLAESKSVRDIAPIDLSTINWPRRLACKYDLELFGRTYMNNAYYLSPAEDHRRSTEKMQTVYLSGGCSL